MNDLSRVLSGLPTGESLSKAIAGLAGKDPGFLRALASCLSEAGDHDAVIRLCKAITDESPTDLEIHLLCIASHSAKGNVEDALGLLITLKNSGLLGEALTGEVHKHLMVAAEVYNQCRAASDFERALRISRLLAELCPGVSLFQDAQMEVRRLVQEKSLSRALELQREDYEQIQAVAAACEEDGNFERELSHRLLILRHPLDANQHSAMRLQNLIKALSRILGVDQDRVSPANVSLAKEMLSFVPSIPPTLLREGGYENDPAACFDRFFRLLLESLDLDMIFGPLLQPTPVLPTLFASSSGAPMDIADVAARSRKLGARVVFSAPASAEYTQIYGKSYATSMLKACDCPALVLICLCAPDARLYELARSVGMDDERLIFCSDNFYPQTMESKIVAPERPDFQIGANRYACASLFRADLILSHLQIPAIMTGIDTVLTRGVGDLIEQFQECDIVLNKAGNRFLMGSQIVNSLIMMYPTEGANIFIEFLKQYMAPSIAKPYTPTFIDQLGIHMAKHYYMNNCARPAIGYFGEYDINNLMFSTSNHAGHVEMMKKYRFLNIFSHGVQDPLTADDVGALVHS